MSIKNLTDEDKKFLKGLYLQNLLGGEYYLALKERGGCSQSHEPIKEAQRRVKPIWDAGLTRSNPNTNFYNTGSISGQLRNIWMILEMDGYGTHCLVKDHEKILKSYRHPHYGRIAFDDITTAKSILDKIDQTKIQEELAVTANQSIHQIKNTNKFNPELVPLELKNKVKNLKNVSSTVTQIGIYALEDNNGSIPVNLMKDYLEDLIGPVEKAGWFKKCTQTGNYLAIAGTNLGLSRGNYTEKVNGIRSWKNDGRQRAMIDYPNWAEIANLFIDIQAYGTGIISKTNPEPNNNSGLSLKELESELEQIESKVSSLETEDKFEVLGRTIIENQKLKSENKKLKSENEAFQHRIKLIESENEKLRSKPNDQIKKIKALESERIKFQKERDNQIKINHELEDEIRRLKNLQKTIKKYFECEGQLFDLRDKIMDSE